MEFFSNLKSNRKFNAAKISLPTNKAYSTSALSVSQVLDSMFLFTHSLAAHVSLPKLSSLKLLAELHVLSLSESTDDNTDGTMSPLTYDRRK
jgi:hypothetical protein